jgi:hypothetical protein
MILYRIVYYFFSIPPDPHDLLCTAPTPDPRDLSLTARRRSYRPFIGLLLTRRVEAEKGYLRRIKIKPPSFLFHRVFSGVAHMGNILGGAYHRSFVAGYNFEVTAFYAAAYRRSIVAVYIAEFSSLCARSWAAIGIVFNPLPAGTQLLPILRSTPSCYVLCWIWSVCSSLFFAGRSPVHLA